MNWALVDVSYLAYRAMYAVGDLSHDEFEMGIIFGFFDQLRNICSDPRISTNRVALCFDSRKSYRQKYFPAYKWRRTEQKGVMDEEEIAKRRSMRRQIKFLREEILPEIGFIILKQSGVESDDVMAMASKTFVGHEKQAIMITADNDLYQCITEAVHWYDPNRKLYYDIKTFFMAKEICPDQWKFVKRIIGCSGDDVPGVPGVGESSAILFLNGFLPKHYKKYDSIMSRRGEQIQYFNQKLTDLPHEKTLPIELKPPVYNPDAFWKWCEKLGVKSFFEGPRAKDWTHFFNGQPDPMRANVRRRKHATLPGEGLGI